MSNINFLMKEVLLKYKSLDANIINERNKLISDEKLHNEICKMLANQSLTQPIDSSIMGGNNKVCSILDEKPEVMDHLPYMEWSKAQLKVIKQRDSIDMLLCELVKTVIENEEVVERKETQRQDVNIMSFLSAALGALLVNIMYNYLTQ